jgi:YVTN family beta-propeller protein/YD repeat-containing protein
VASFLLLAFLALLPLTASAQKAYIPNNSSNTVTVINTSTNAPCTTATCVATATYPISVGSGPYGVAVSPDGSKAFIANDVSNSVSVINTATDTVSATISVGHGPTGVALLPNGLYAYVVNTADATVSVISTASNTVTATITLTGTPPPPSGIAASPDGSKIYVSAAKIIEGGPASRVFAISTASNSITATITGFTEPYGGLAVSPDGTKLYVPDVPGLVIVNTASSTISSTIALDGGSATNEGIALSQDGSTAYVTSSGTTTGGGTVFVINLSTLAVASSISVGGSPYGVALSTDGTTVYAVNASTNSVAPIIAATGTELTTAATGSLPYALGVFIQPGNLAKQLGPHSCGCNSAAAGVTLMPVNIAGALNPVSTAASADPSSTIASNGTASGGEPIDIGSGNVSYQFTDYTTVGLNPLVFTRYYNSRSPGLPSFAITLGANWRSTFDRYIHILTSSHVTAERAGGQQVSFTLAGSTWTPDSDVDMTLSLSGTTWTLIDHDDTVETYTTTMAGNEALLNSIKARNGYTQTLSYSGSQLSTVTDSYSRSLTFTYNSNGLLEFLATPDSETLTYGYTASGSTYNLTSLTYPTSPTQTVTYAYTSSSLPNALTGVIDENSNQFLTWTYDALGRGLTSVIGPSSVNANLTTIAYTGNNVRTVTNALGVTDTYTFTTFQGVPKLTGIIRASTSTTPAMTRTLTYDSNGYMASQTDWNGNSTTYANNSHGLPTTINEAVGSSVARTTTIAYDTTWVHLPDSITTPGVTLSFTFDSSGNPLTRKLTDTTSTTIPYSTNGQTRTWTYTWSSYLPATVKTPNGNTTHLTYTSGVLTAVQNALSQTASVTSYKPGGLPLTSVDTNSVTTNYTYDPRLRLLTSVLVTGAGNLTTSNTYYTNSDWVTTLPDSSAFVYQLDQGHRLSNVVDSDGNNDERGYDAASNVAVVFLANSSYVAKFQRNYSHDALSRMLTDESQTTGLAYTYTYDHNGNALTVADPLGNTTTRVFDALNRLSTSTDANTGVTSKTYDAHNRPLTITDPTSHVTSYVYNGFGDLIQQTSPDSGTAVYHYDSDGNMTSRTDAASVVTNQTFDALDRVLTTTYPADSAENVSYTYDQTGHGKGIGRLTSLTDASGSLSRTYDERGNILTEQRINGTNTLTTTYTYDNASRTASITYPSGMPQASLPPCRSPRPAPM